LGSSPACRGRPDRIGVTLRRNSSLASPCSEAADDDDVAVVLDAVGASIFDPAEHGEAGLRSSVIDRNSHVEAIEFSRRNA
jgi:hypothetical protein